MTWTKDNGKFAKDAAEQALLQANQAKEAAEYLDEKKPLIDKFTNEQTNLQAQINQLVVDGESSPEAAQARVGVDDTEYSTLKARLDNEYEQVTQQLAQIAVNVNQFSRLPNETTDNGRFQRAINYVNSMGGGTITVTDNYIVDGPIEILSNISIIGGNGNNVKVADFCTGYYAIFKIHSSENVAISGINFDGNVGRSNYAIDDPMKPEIAIYIVNSNNIRITNNYLKTCGVWTVSCEVSEVFPHNDYIYIQDNIVEYTVGKSTDRVNPQIRVDTTQFYIDAKNYWVERNTLSTSNGGDDVAETAIEAHRSLGIVRDNVVNGFKNAVLVVPGFFAETYESTMISIVNNKFYNVLNGVTLWQINVRDLSNVSISDNSIEIDPNRFNSPQSSYGISTLDTLETNNGNKNINNIIIHSNTIKFLPFTSSYASSDFTLNFCGIKLFSYVSLKGIKITNNQIIDSPSIGIIIGARGSVENPNKADGINVTNNTIINAGKNTNISTDEFNPRTPIRVNGNGGAITENIIVRDNTIIDDRESGNYFTRDVRVIATNQNTTIVTNNTYVCKGKELLDAKRSYEIPISWDSQIGTPIITKVSNYIKLNNSVKLSSQINFTSMGDFTQGYGCFVLLPVAPSQNCTFPVTVTGVSTVAAGRQYFIELTSGSKTAYIRSINPDGTLSALTQGAVTESTKIGINIEYFD